MLMYDTRRHCRPANHNLTGALLCSGRASLQQGKSFSAFLSHFKLECGTEARLVRNDLQLLLPADEDVFLDSGAAS